MNIQNIKHKVIGSIVSAFAVAAAFVAAPAMAQTSPFDAMVGGCDAKASNFGLDIVTQKPDGTYKLEQTPRISTVGQAFNEAFAITEAAKEAGSNTRAQVSCTPKSSELKSAQPPSTPNLLNGQHFIP